MCVSDHAQPRGNFGFALDPACRSPAAALRGGGSVTFAGDGMVLGDTAIPTNRRAYWEFTLRHGGDDWAAGAAAGAVGNPYVGIARREAVDLQTNLGRTVTLLTSPLHSLLNTPTKGGVEHRQNDSLAAG